MLMLLGGPPGVGKTTVVEELRQRGTACLEADEISDPNEHLQRDVAIGNVLEAATRALDETPKLLVSWVFARSELYQPFLDHFADIRIKHLYLVCDQEVLRARLASRGDPALFEYALSRLQLINELPYEKIDTSSIETSVLADVISKRFDDHLE